MTETLATAFVTFIVILDPLGTVPMYVSLTSGLDRQDRLRVAWGASAIAAVVLMAVAAGGDALLRSMGISLAAFRIAGGALLFLLSIDMVFARQTGLRSATSGERAEAIHRQDVTVFPLAIPLIAGPGAISSTVLLVGAEHGSVMGQLGVASAMLAALALNLICLLAAASVMRWLGLTGVNVIVRVFGIVVAPCRSSTCWTASGKRSGRG